MNSQRIGNIDSGGGRSSSDEPNELSFSALAEIARELGERLSPELSARLQARETECESYRELFDNQGVLAAA